MLFAPECFWVFEGRPLFGWFLKNFPSSPLCTFSQNGAFGWPCENIHNLAIGALLDPHLRQNLSQSLHFKCILNKRWGYLRQCASGPFKRGHLFGRYLKNILWSPLCTFSENAASGRSSENCHDLAIRAILEPLFAPQCFPVFAD